MKRIAAFIIVVVTAFLASAESAVVYYRKGDSDILTPVTVDAEHIDIESLFGLMQKPPFGEDVNTVVPAGSRFIGSVSAGKIAEIRIETAVEPDSNFVESLGKTICGNTPAQSVTVIVNGRFFGRYPDDGRAVIWYPVSGFDYVVPTLIDCELTPSGLLSALEHGEDAFLPTNTLKSGDAQIAYSFAQDGRRVMNIDFTMSVFSALESAEETRWQFLAAVSRTMLYNIKGIDCMRISFDGQTVQGVPDKNGILLIIENGYIDRNCFEECTGLQVGETFINQNDAGNPRAILPALMPDVISASDVIAWSIENGVLSIAFSNRFFEACADFDITAERETVYTIVNSLCLATGAKSVRITEEGKTVQTLAGSISLESDLLPVCE